MSVYKEIHEFKQKIWSEHPEFMLISDYGLQEIITIVREDCRNKAIKAVDKLTYEIETCEEETGYNIALNEVEIAITDALK